MRHENETSKYFCALTCTTLEKGKKAKRNEKGRKVCIRLNYTLLMWRFYQATYVANCRHTNASSLMKNSFNRTGGKLFQIVQNISKNRSNFNFKGETKVPTASRAQSFLQLIVGEL